MKEDILRFRKLVEILMKKGWPIKKLCAEIAVSWPTLNKLLTTPIDEIKPRASILGAVQDFTKKNLIHLDYPDSGEALIGGSLVKAKPGVKQTRDKVLADMEEKGKPTQPESKREMMRGEFDEILIEMQRKNSLPAEDMRSTPDLLFWDHIREASYNVPANIIITITISRAK